MILLPLNKESIHKITNDVSKPSYSSEQCGLGIVHMGIGAFHRGHQAVYTDKMLEKKTGDWRITAVSLRSGQVRDQLAHQDNLYTVVERSAKDENVFVVGAIDEVLVAPENPQRVIDVLAGAETKIVTITVTEKGYCRTSSGKGLNLEDETIIHDLANIENPKSLPGYIVAACKKRKCESNLPLTIISCDNLPENGLVTATVVLEFAKALDALDSITINDAASLSYWINKNVSFCNSMVDRIVPAISEQEIAEIANKYQFKDHSVIVTEPFKQWVIENNFIGERPPWDIAGAMFVDDVSQYEQMKLRLLNGAHSTLAYNGYLLGFEYIHQAIEDPLLRDFVEELQNQLIASLNEVPGINLSDYAREIRERFANQYVPYKTSQVACDGSQKLPQRLLQPLEFLIKSELPYQHILFVVAIWFRYLQGRDEDDNSFDISDPLAAQLLACAFEYKDDVSEQVIQLIKISNIFGDYLANDSRFIDELSEQLSNINEYGVRGALLKVTSLEHNYSLQN